MNKIPAFKLALIALILSMLACNFGNTPAPTEVPSNGAPDSTAAPESPVDAPPAASACTNPYLPVVVGATWNYDLKGPQSDTYTHSVLSAEGDRFVEQDVFNSGVSRQAEWQCQNGNLIALNPSGAGTSNVSAEGVDAKFETKDLSGITLPATINPGDTWSQSLTLEGVQILNGLEIPSSNQLTSDCTAIGIESVTVPAGAFDAMRVDCHTVMNITITMGGSPIQSTLDLNGTNWYALNVGMVKSSTVGSGLDSTVELLAYNIP